MQLGPRLIHPSLQYLSPLLMTFTNSLDQDLDHLNIDPYYGFKSFDTLIVFLKFFLKKLILKKVSRRQQNHENLPSMRRANLLKGQANSHFPDCSSRSSLICDYLVVGAFPV